MDFKKMQLKSLNTEKNRNGFLLLIGAGFVLMPFVSHLLIGLSKMTAAYILLPVSLIVFGSHLQVLRFPEMKLAALLPLWFVFGCVINFSRGVTTIGYTFFASVTAVLLFCFSFFYVVPEQKVRTFLRYLAWIWSVPMTCASLFGIYLAVNGLKLAREGHDEPIGVTGEGRLFLFGNPNTLGVMCVIAFALLLFLLLHERKKGIRILLAGMTAAVFTGLALSDCRSAKIAMIFPAFLFTVLVIRKAVKRPQAARLAAGIAGGVLAAALLFAVWSGVKTGVNAVLKMKTEAAETETVEYLDSRDYAVTDDLYDTGNVRLVLWKYALEHVTRLPASFLFGYTPMAVKDEFIAPNPGIITVYDHIHCGYIGILISYGVIGLLGFLAFLVMLLKASCRLLFAKADKVPDAVRFLPVLLAVILIVNCTEELLFTRSTVQETNVWFALAAGAVFVLDRYYKNKSSDTGR